MNPSRYIAPIVIGSILAIAGTIAGYSLGLAKGKRVALEMWQQAAGDLGMSMVTRYDPITGAPRMVLIDRQGRGAVRMEIKP